MDMSIVYWLAELVAKAVDLAGDIHQTSISNVAVLPTDTHELYVLLEVIQWEVEALKNGN